MASHTGCLVPWSPMHACMHACAVRPLSAPEGRCVCRGGTRWAVGGMEVVCKVADEFCLGDSDSTYRTHGNVVSEASPPG